MNVVGFLKKHDTVVACSKELDELLTGSPISAEELQQIISYLKDGVPVFKYMGSVYDTDGTDTGQLKYCTDGEWLWPSYYAYYLQKYPNLKVPPLFIDHIKAKKKVRALSDEEILYGQYLYLRLTNTKIPNNPAALKKVQPFIDAQGEELVCC